MTTRTVRHAHPYNEVRSRQPIGGSRRIRVLMRRRRRWLTSRVHRLRTTRGDAGMTTAEYAVGTVAACGFAALLYKVVTSGAVSGAISELLNRALHAV
ncbi:DUF4244 domain-containing protein [Kitasatospora sp. NPDC096147]|uniref:DUF4244 domain-containing protein n=1 Tax=Kitasatospora sp. NPDC096147 TaxID=3364093 RepID=UPI00382FEEFD